MKYFTEREKEKQLARIPSRSAARDAMRHTRLRKMRDAGTKTMSRGKVTSSRVKKFSETLTFSEVTKPRMC